MGSFSIWHLLILAVVVFLLFGRGKVSDLMGDVAKGIKNFRKGLQDEPEPPRSDHFGAPRRRQPQETEEKAEH